MRQYLICTAYQILSSIIRAITSRRIGWAGHVARIGETRCMQNCVENLEEEDHLHVLVADGRIILKWILRSCTKKG